MCPAFLKRMPGPGAAVSTSNTSGLPSSTVVNVATPVFAVTMLDALAEVMAPRQVAAWYTPPSTVGTAA